MVFLVLSCLSFSFFSFFFFLGFLSTTAATYNFTAPTCTGTIIIPLEPCALNAEFHTKFFTAPTCSVQVL